MLACRTSRIAALTLTLVAYPAAHASAQMAVSVGVAAGATVPRSRFGDRASTGYHVMATLGMSAPLVPLSFRVEGMFNEFDYNSAVGSGGGGVYRVASDKARVWGATANGILTSSGLLRPYLIGGVGMYRTTEGNPPFGGTVSSNSWGGNLGGGFRFDLTGFGAYAEARYHWVGDTDVRMIPITFGLSF